MLLSTVRPFGPETTGRAQERSIVCTLAASGYLERDKERDIDLLLFLTAAKSSDIFRGIRPVGLIAQTFQVFIIGLQETDCRSNCH